MGDFWPKFQVHAYSFDRFKEEMRRRDYSKSSINRVLHQLATHKVSIEALDDLAFQERNVVSARSAVRGLLNAVDSRINQMLDLLNRIEEDIKVAKSEIIDLKDQIRVQQSHLDAAWRRVHDRDKRKGLNWSGPSGEVRNEERKLSQQQDKLVRLEERLEKMKS